MVSRPMSLYDQWYLAVQNAIRDDQPPPLPPGRWDLTPAQIRGWRDYIRATIHTAAPLTPDQWVRQRQGELEAPTRADLWAEVIALRSAAQDAS